MLPAIPARLQLSAEQQQAIVRGMAVCGAMLDGVVAERRAVQASMAAVAGSGPLAPGGGLKACDYDLSEQQRSSERLMALLLKARAAARRRLRRARSVIVLGAPASAQASS